MRRFVSVLALSLLIALPVSAAETIDAVWKEQKVEFTFLSLGTAYSCDAIQGRIRTLLRHVGAADDLEVTTPPCPGIFEPRRRHRVTARFSTLVPATDGDVNTVKAAWTEVELGERHPLSIDGCDCELLKYFRKFLLPVIEHQVIDVKKGCSTSRHSVAVRLRLKVLMPVADGAAAEG